MSQDRVSSFHPIGMIHTPFPDPAQVTILSVFNEIPVEVEIFKLYREGMNSLANFFSSRPDLHVSSCQDFSDEQGTDIG